VKSKKILFWIPAIFLIFPFSFLVNNFELTYSLSSKAIIYPIEEWTLFRSETGNLINSLKNYRYNTIKEYSVTEFQRGDHAKFSILPEIFEKDFLYQGDTVGVMVSQFEKRNIIELQGELLTQKKLLDVYKSGEKPENIEIARERKVLAQQELEIQERVTERNKTLYDRAYISEEEYELSLKEYYIKKQNYLIADNTFNAISTGAKKEEIAYIDANIKSIEAQIKQLENMVDNFTIVCPINGKLIRDQRVVIGYDAILKVADITKLVLLIPIDAYNISNLFLGQKVLFNDSSNNTSYSAEIVSFDNSAQMLDGKQKIFVTAITSDLHENHSIYPNMMVDVTIESESISILTYISRLVNEIYNN
jgi:hypothetical protein